VFNIQRKKNGPDDKNTATLKTSKIEGHLCDLSTIVP
jgi:hypothetical protein